MRRVNLDGDHRAFMVNKVAELGAARNRCYVCDVYDDHIIIERKADPELKQLQGRPTLHRLDDMAMGETRDFDLPASKLSAVRLAINRCRALGMNFTTTTLPSGVLQVKRVEPVDGERGVGRARLYPFEQLEVGDTFTVPAPANVGSIRHAASNYGRLWNMRFTVSDMRENGVVVKRLAGGEHVRSGAAAAIVITRASAVHVAEPVPESAPEPAIPTPAEIEEQNREAAAILAAAAKLKEEEF